MQSQFNPTPLVIKDDSFRFPFSDLKSHHQCRDDLTLADFKNLRCIGRGSTSDIFSGIFVGHADTVVLKIIKANLMDDPDVSEGFDKEFQLLCRLNHPNIVRVLGAGVIPRKFIVLEHLEGGSVESMQSKFKKSRSKLSRKVCALKTFSFLEVLRHAKELASAMDYLHSEVCNDASIIHRDLKTANIGFSRTGVLKVFDFGLSTCVQHTCQNDDVYELTGCTGTLRFMAPEVARGQAYTEKVDVYSFGIIIWQMMEDKVFKDGMNREEFMADVVVGGDRPKIKKSWPKQFSSLLQTCWDTESANRPSFSEIVNILDTLADVTTPVDWKSISGVVMEYKKFIRSGSLLNIE